MPSLRSAAALMALSGLVAGSPLDKRDAFSIEQVHMGTFAKNHVKHLAHTYSKFGGQLPYDLVRAAASNGTGTGTVVTNPGDQYDALYLTPVNVGGTTMMLDFDTGSADLWVFSSDLTTDQQSGHAIYKTTPANKKAGQTWEISYGDGSGASGDVYADSVAVGGVTATSQAVEAANSISAQFNRNNKNDGLLGLAFSKINTVKPQPETTWFDTAVQEGALKEAVFGVKLVHQAPGQYDFGFADTKAYTGDVAYADVDSSRGFWEFKSDGYAVGGTKGSASIDAIADTGTSLVLIDEAVVSDYYKGVQGAQYDATQGGYTFPCDAELPDFSLMINGQERTTPGKFMNFQPITGNSCFGGIQRNTGLQGLSIIGDTFLKSQYVIFDKKGPRVGFAKQA